MKSDQFPPTVYLLGIFLMVYLLQPCLRAQTQSNPDASTGDANKSWTVTTGQELPGNTNPTRSSETHSEGGGRTVDRQSVERIGSDGRYEPYLDTEKETVKIDATTVKTVSRTFGRDSDGRRTLVQVTEEEQRSLPGGEVKIVRTTSNPDANGDLQIVQREIQDTKQTSPEVQETKTTVLMPDLNGGLTPSLQTEERQTKTSDHDVKFRKSTLLPDGNGRWQVSEVREGTVKDDGKDRTKNERVSRLGADGNLGVVERTVSKESKPAAGEASETVETYSTEIPGSAADGSLHLNQRVTTIHRKREDGGQSTEKQIEQRNPAEPNDGLRVTQKTIDIGRPGLDGTSKETQTIQSLDSNGNLAVVSVDIGKKEEKSSAIQVDIAPAKAH